MTHEQADLFLETRIRAAAPDVFRPQRERPAQVKRKARRVQASSLEARPSESLHAEIRRTVLACIAEAGSQGRTRQEIADRTGVKLQSVCSSVVRLIELQHAHEPVVGYNAAGFPLHARRDGRNIVCAGSGVV